MKRLMIIPVGLIGLMALGRSGPVQPLNAKWSVASDTTVPGNNGSHRMKGNSSDTSGTGRHGKWGKGKHDRSGMNQDSSKVSNGNATGTSNPATGTGTGTGSTSSPNK